MQLLVSHLYFRRLMEKNEKPIITESQVRNKLTHTTQIHLITITATIIHQKKKKIKIKAIVGQVRLASSSKGKTAEIADRLIYLQNSYNDTKEANCTAEDFHNEDLHEETGILGVCQRRSAAHDADTDAAEEVGKAHGQTSPKHGVTWSGRNQQMQRPP